MIKMDLSEFLGFVDMNGVDALNLDQVAWLEDFVAQCHESANEGEHKVVDAIYDRLMEILRRVNPDSELCKYIWEDSVDEMQDIDELFQKNPMYSIQTVKSYECDEIRSYMDRLPNSVFDLHISAKLNGHGIRLTYQNGKLVQARSRARASAGRDITPQLSVIVPTELQEFADTPTCEIRGEWCLPFSNMPDARTHKDKIVSAFSGVSAMGKASGTVEQWGLLRFVAYEVVVDDFSFESKSEEYEYLEELGFEVPANWVVEGVAKANFLEEVKSIVSDCEEEIGGEENYDYYTDGLICTLNRTDLFQALGDDGSHYRYGNIALKVGFWSQDMYEGYVKTILWMKGKTKLSPVAIVAPADADIEFIDGDDHAFVFSVKDIENFDDMGIVTAGGNKVRRVPLYEPSNMLQLNAFKGYPLYFRYGGEAGVVPCFPDGTPLLEGKVKNAILNDYVEEESNSGWSC